MRTVCLRYFNVYGPRQDPSSEYSGVIARFMDAAVAREAPRYVVYGDGRQSRDFVYIADVVAANLLALDACLASPEGTGKGSAADQEGGAGTGHGGGAGEGGEAVVAAASAGGASAGDIDGTVLNGTVLNGTVLNGAVLNIGSGESVDVLTLAREIERLRLSKRMGEDQATGPAEPAIEFRAPREGDIRASRADIARARRLLGYEPVTSFADGLAATYAWYAGHTGAGVS